MPEIYAQDWWLIQRFGKQRYLLLSLVAILVLQPLLSSQETSRFWTVMILTLIMVTGPLALATQRFDFYFTLLLGVVMASTSWLGNYVEGSVVMIIDQTTTVLFFLMLGVLIFKQFIFSNDGVTEETLFAAAFHCTGEPATHVLWRSFNRNVGPPWRRRQDETRKLIDPQLRGAAWTVDSVNLRYSKGTWPKRGMNLGIAEWPTASSPADYVFFVGLTPIRAALALARFARNHFSNSTSHSTEEATATICNQVCRSRGRVSNRYCRGGA